MGIEQDRGQEGLIQVHVAGDPFEADILMNALEKEGIARAFRKHEEIAYDGLFVLQRGWGAILVPVGEAGRAREIIVEALKAYGKRGVFRNQGPDSGAEG